MSSNYSNTDNCYFQYFTSHPCSAPKNSIKSIDWMAAAAKDDNTITLYISSLFFVKFPTRNFTTSHANWYINEWIPKFILWNFNLCHLYHISFSICLLWIIDSRNQEEIEGILLLSKTTTNNCSWEYISITRIENKWTGKIRMFFHWIRSFLNFCFVEKWKNKRNVSKMIEFSISTSRNCISVNTNTMAVNIQKI